MSRIKFSTEPFFVSRTSGIGQEEKGIIVFFLSFLYRKINWFAIQIVMSRWAFQGAFS